MLQIRIFAKQRAEFLPGILWLNVWKIALGEFGAANRLDTCVTQVRKS